MHVVIFRGRIGSADEHKAIRDAIKAIAPPESSNLLCAKRGKDCVYVRDLEGNVVRESDSQTPQTHIFSGSCLRNSELLDAEGKPYLMPITIDDLPVDIKFGNGITINTQIELRNGESVRLSWCVFPDIAKPLTDANIEQIRRIMEE